MKFSFLPILFFLSISVSHATSSCVWKKTVLAERVSSCRLTTFKGTLRRGKFLLKAHASALDCGYWKMDLIVRMKKRAARLCALVKGRARLFRWVDTIQVKRSFTHYMYLSMLDQKFIDQRQTMQRIRRALVDVRSGQKHTFVTVFPRRHSMIWKQLKKQFLARKPKERQHYRCSQEQFLIVQKRKKKFVRFLCYGKKGAYRDSFLLLDVPMPQAAKPTSQSVAKRASNQRNRWYKRCSKRLFLEFMQYFAWRSFLQLPASWFQSEGVNFRVGDSKEERTLWYVRHSTDGKKCALHKVNTGQVRLQLAAGKSLSTCKSKTPLTVFYLAGPVPLLLLRTQCHRSSRYTFFLRRGATWTTMSKAMQPKLSKRLQAFLRERNTSTKSSCAYRVGYDAKPSRFAIHLYAESPCAAHPRYKLASFLWAKGRLLPRWSRSVNAPPKR